MTIVAHQDDDILFMNPDIDASLAAGGAETTVFVTAGDAGLGPSYWMGREAGAKAAYSLMTGIDDWVDETVTLSLDGGPVEVASAHPLGMPEVRLYFLRLPDGGGALAPGEEQQLARLQEGTLSEVTAVDGSATHTRAGLVEALSAIVGLHDPAAFRLQLADGENAAGEHTDHTNVTDFAEEAIAAWDGETFTVTHYVQYASRDMAANLSDAEAARALEIMEAYAEYDPGVWNGEGGLQQVYVDWTARQHVDRVIEVDPDNPYTPDVAAPAVDPGDDAPGATYALAGDDAFLFVINGASGAIAPQDWFVPSLDDAWDANEDHVYDLVRLETLPDGTVTEEPIRLETTAEGVLTPQGIPDTPEEPEDPAEPPAPDEPPIPEDPPAPDEPPVPDVSPPPDAPPEPDQPPEVDTPPADPPAPELGGLAYSLSGPDAFLFQIDATTGAIAPQDWFVPSLGDAWDADEDHVYDLIRVGTPSDGGASSEEALSFETTAEGVLTPLGGSTPDAGAPTEPEPEAPSPPAPTPDDPAGPPPDDDAPPPENDVPWSVSFSLDGPDAQLFVIDSATGAVDLQTWFEPSRDDAWDRDEDHVYEITRVSTPWNGGAPTREDLRFETLPDGTFGPVTSGEALMTALALPDEESAPDDAEFEDETEMDALA